jgi:hypothetical protein
MGRKKIYLSDEEKKQAQRRWNNDYYIRNKIKLDKYAKERYSKNKNM